MKINSNELSKFIAKRRWIRRLNIFEISDKTWVDFLGKKLFIDSTDWKGPSYHVLNWGVASYEKQNVDFIINYFHELGGKGVFLDIGANIGIFSFMLTTKMQNVNAYCFEPEPKTYSCLKSTFSDSFFKERVSTFSIALSDKDGSSKFFVDNSNHGGHSLNLSSILDDGSFVSNELVVETVRLDNFIRNNQIENVDFIKIDVQRHESEVLSGAVECIHKFRPLFLMECYFQDLLVPHSHLLSPFLDKDYLILSPKTLQIYSLDQESLNELKGSEAYCDLVFIPKEKLNRISGAHFRT